MINSYSFFSKCFAWVEDLVLLCAQGLLQNDRELFNAFLSKDISLYQYIVLFLLKALIEMDTVCSQRHFSFLYAPCGGSLL